MPDNIEKETLTEAAVSSTEASNQDAKGASSAQDETLADALKGVIAEKAADSSTETGEQETAVEAEAALEDAAKVDEGKADEGKKEETKADDADVPFHKHPRWIEKQNELKQAKAELDSAKQSLKSYEYLAQYRESNGINDEQFAAAMEFVALVNTNPGEARKRLAPIMEQLAAFDESTIPSDLAKKVSDGIIDEETAKEMAQLRVHNRLKDTQVKNTTVAAQRQQEAARTVALNAWETSKRKLDPDFDQKLPWVKDRFIRLIAETKAKDANDYVVAAETAFEQVSRELSTVVPKKATAKVPDMGKSSVNGQKRKEPANMQELLQQFVADRNK